VLVALVQVIVLCYKTQAQYPGLQLLVLLPSPALAAVGGESCGINSQWNAGLASIAVRAVGKHAAASKAVGYQVGVGGVVN